MFAGELSVCLRRASRRRRRRARHWKMDVMSLWLVNRSAAASQGLPAQTARTSRCLSRRCTHTHTRTRLFVSLPRPSRAGPSLSSSLVQQSLACAGLGVVCFPLVLIGSRGSCCKCDASRAGLARHAGQGRAAEPSPVPAEACRRAERRDSPSRTGARPTGASPNPT